MTNYPRDFIGYAANPPDPRWPGSARLAINFVVNYEEGGERSNSAWRSDLGNAPLRSRHGCTYPERARPQYGIGLRVRRPRRRMASAQIVAGPPRAIHRVRRRYGVGAQPVGRGSDGGGRMRLRGPRLALDRLRRCRNRRRARAHPSLRRGHQPPYWIPSARVVRRHPQPEHTASGRRRG